jgi:hypothetical protein
MQECYFKVGDRVQHYRDPSYIGTITHIEDNYLSVMVLWDDCDGEDFQWINKIILLDENE